MMPGAVASGSIEFFIFSGSVYGWSAMTFEKHWLQRIGVPPGGGPTAEGAWLTGHRSQVLHDVPRSGRSAQSGFSSRVSGLGNQRPEYLLCKICLLIGGAKGLELHIATGPG